MEIAGGVAMYICGLMIVLALVCLLGGKSRPDHEI